MCYIIGDGPEYSNLNGMIKKYGLESNIKLISQKQHIGDYLQLFDIFVLPSDQSESFGNSVVEAMGVGIPSIVFKDSGGIVEHIQNNCGFIAENVDDLVTLLKKLMDSPELRKKVGQNGMEYVRSKYSIGNMIQAYSDLYLNS
jgi:glycosyltransferase involved in cell wall biosynthesis